MSQTTGNLTVCSTHCSNKKQRKHESSTLLAHFVGNSLVTSGFSSQKANNVESVSMPCCNLSVHDLMSTVKPLV